MYLGKAQSVTVSGKNRNEVLRVAIKYAGENGYEIFRNIREVKKFSWAKFRFNSNYEVELVKPIDFKITRF